MRRTLNSKYSIIYATLGLATLGFELSGVFGDGSGDTISEHYWWLAENTHGLAHIPMVGGLIWLAYHFIFQATKGK